MHQRILILDYGSQVTQLIARRVREAGAHEQRQHEADERGDDTIVGRVIKQHFGDDAHCAQQHEAREHARRRQPIYIQRLCVMSMMSTL